MESNIYGNRPLLPDPRQEYKVAERAKRMLESSISNSISTFKSHYQGKRQKQRQPLKDFNIRIDGHEWRGTFGDMVYSLDQIALEMGKHGFVQHYGVNASTRSRGDRKKHKVRRRDAKPYERKKHDFKLPEVEFIGSSIDRSGAVDYILREITQLRGKQVFAKISHLMNETTKKYMDK